MQVTSSLIATALLLAAQPSSAERTDVSSDYATVSHAVISLIDEVQVPAEQAGVLKSLELEDGTRVREGIEVQSGWALGKLDDQDALARQRAAMLDHRVAMAEKEKSKVAIEAASKTADVAAAEYDESQAVNRRVPNSIPETQLRRQRLTEERALAEAKVAVSDSETAGLTVQLREAQIEVASLNVDRHAIKSPIDGEVVEIHRHVGEWVNPGDPILRIVRLDRLRVGGFVDLDEYNRAEIAGQPVKVDIRLPGHNVSFEGQISYVSPLIQASGGYRVWCEIDNRRMNGQWVMLPGMKADMTIRLKKQQLAVID